MRATLPLASLLIASAIVTIAPAFAQSSAQDQDIVGNEAQPRGERWEDRWRGRQHILYDEVWQDGTDGYASEAKQDCRAFAMRYKRADGTTAIRRDNRCDQ